jgi:hypothetical protein
MTNRVFHLSLVGWVVLGPFMFFITFAFGVSDFSFFLFPITLESFLLLPGTDLTKDLSYLRLIVPFFILKIFVIGIITWIKLSKSKHGGPMLTRFYVLVLVVLFIKLVALLTSDVAHQYGFAIAAVLIWVILISVALRKHLSNSGISPVLAPNDGGTNIR